MEEGFTNSIFKLQKMFWAKIQEHYSAHNTCCPPPTLSPPKKNYISSVFSLIDRDENFPSSNPHHKPRLFVSQPRSLTTKLPHDHQPATIRKNLSTKTRKLSFLTDTSTTGDLSLRFIRHYRVVRQWIRWCIKYLLSGTINPKLRVDRPSRQATKYSNSEEPQRGYLVTTSW